MGRVLAGPDMLCRDHMPEWLPITIYDDSLRVALAAVPPRCATDGSAFYDLGMLPAGHYMLSLGQRPAVLLGGELGDPERCAMVSPEPPGPYSWCSPVEFDVRPCGVTVVALWNY